MLDIDTALANADKALEDLFESLAALEGPGRKKAIEACIELGFTHTQIAKEMAISRQRLYQLLA